jgi:outer membrane protein OmpA-like peptidoglycan-associated protein
MSKLGLRLHADEEHWIPLADLMTGLMFLFLLIALAYMVQVELQAHRAKQVAVIYEQTRMRLYQDLYREFHNDLHRWHADLYRDTLSIRFKEPDVLFPTGSNSLQPKFAAILDSFFPRYVRILTSPAYHNSITEVRIEGYTSTIWHSGASVQEAYIDNMELSQSRTRSVLNYVLAMRKMQPYWPWLRERVTANGLSSSHLILKSDRSEDQGASQRVEFRVITDADAQIKKVLELPQ